jgi:cutinase
VPGFAAAALLAAALVIAPAAVPFPSAPPIPGASAACPGAEVVFARGREEPPGVGFVGDAFVNSLQGKAHMPVGSYGVNYPADVDPAKGTNGTRRVLGPVPDFSPAFAGKTIDQCASGDPICSNGTTWSAHLQPSYINSGLVDQAATFAASRL